MSAGGPTATASRRNDARPVTSTPIRRQAASPAPMRIGILRRFPWVGRGYRILSYAGTCSTRHAMVAAVEPACSTISAPIWCAGHGRPVLHELALPGRRHRSTTTPLSAMHAAGWNWALPARPRELDAGQNGISSFMSSRDPAPAPAMAGWRAGALRPPNDPKLEPL